MRPHATQSRWSAAYLLVIVGLIALLNAYDRSLITILVTPMKRDLDLSDTFSVNNRSGNEYFACR